VEDLVNVYELKTTGLSVQYYLVCQRKLWLHTHHIQFEQDSDKVLQGKVLHEQSYNSHANKELLIDDLIKIDLFNDYVGEVKTSSRMQQSDRMQLLYYLYVLKQAGITKVGKLHYPKEKKVEEVILTNAAIDEVERVLVGIQGVKDKTNPPPLIKLPYCSKCAYYSFCWVGEEE
jgi:CRISPR-associated exonuclease Cas4